MNLHVKHFMTRRLHEQSMVESRHTSARFPRSNYHETVSSFSSIALARVQDSFALSKTQELTSSLQAKDSKAEPRP